MTSLDLRQTLLDLIHEAVQAGAHKTRACELLGVDVRTIQRWEHSLEDGRTGAALRVPANKLSEIIRKHILQVVLIQLNLWIYHPIKSCRD